MTTSPAGARLRHVKAVTRGDSTWLYYRRGGRQWPLPGPEGSTAFLAEYHRIHAAYGRLRAETPAGVPGTIDAAVTLYLGSADFRSLRATTQRDYRRVLDQFRGAFGPLHLADLDLGWWDRMRDKHVSAPQAWNNIRSRMREVVALYRRRHPELVPANPLAEVKRLAVAQSDQNRAWPAELLGRVLAAATPDFRALLIGYLLTTQRGGDVTTWRWDQYDEAAGLLTMRQRKTGRALVLHVQDLLAAAIATQRGRHPERIFATPRGRPWKLPNAQETLARLLAQLGEGRYTLHGLRATGPTALERAGMERRHIRDITGHESDRTLEIYLRGAGGFVGRRRAAEALQAIFAPVLEDAATDANARRFSGVTGRAARRLATDVETGNSEGGASGRKPRKL
jgi:hypothetical protein